MKIYGQILHAHCTSISFFQGLTKEFQIKDDNQVGKTEITYEDFLEMVFSCGPLFS